MPCAAAHSARPRACAGDDDVRLTSAPPVGGVDASVACTAASSRTQTTASGLAANAEPAVSARIAPRATNGSILAAVRFHTVVRCPASRNAPASAWPIGPRPITVTAVSYTRSPWFDYRTIVKLTFQVEGWPII